MTSPTKRMTFSPDTMTTKGGPAAARQSWKAEVFIMETLFGTVLLYILLISFIGMITTLVACAIQAMVNENKREKREIEKHDQDNKLFEERMKEYEENRKKQ